MTWRRVGSLTCFRRVEARFACFSRFSASLMTLLLEGFFGAGLVGSGLVPISFLSMMHLWAGTPTGRTRPVGKVPGKSPTGWIRHAINGRGATAGEIGRHSRHSRHGRAAVTPHAGGFRSYHDSSYHRLRHLQHANILQIHTVARRGSLSLVQAPGS